MRALFDRPTVARSTTERPLPIAKPLRTIAAIAAVVLVGGVILQILAILMPGEGIFSKLSRGGAALLYADNEGNIWSWLSATLLAVLAAALGLNALIAGVTGRRVLPFAVLAGLALYMSIDEAAVLHEKFSLLVKNFPLHLGWLIIGIPLAVVVGAAVLVVARNIDRVMRRRFILAGALFVLGAVVIEIFEKIQGSMMTPAELRGSIPFVLEIGVEEGLELSGVLIALWAALDALSIRASAKGLVLESAAATTKAER